MSNDFGLERDWYNRVAYYSERDNFDFSIQPSKRTNAQKFEASVLVALTELKKLNLYSKEKENEFLSSDYLLKINSENNSLNGPTFVLVFSCYDFTNHRLVMKKNDYQFSIEDLLDLIKKDTVLDDFCKQYGITIPDIIRYIIYVQNLKV